MVWTDLTWSAERESSRSPYFSSVTIDRSGAWWTGTEASDLVDYLKEFTAAGYPAERVLQISCSGCGSDKFRVRLDDEEGCAVRTCTGCDTTSFVFDSEDFVEDADLTRTSLNHTRVILHRLWINLGINRLEDAR